ncbi:ribokinase [Microbaculum marinum]|uniref:Ribokinase n=1 Tax=Microbaculum marinum TaxID=1764581 RepID=A0AAW9RNT5_9HYPH
MPRVLVFGSINLDIITPVPRLPVSGETVLGGDALISAGGKGANQAHAARLAGVEVTMIGRVGDDDLAAPALALLTAAGVDLSGVGVSSRATGCATIWTGPEGSSTIVVSPGANADLRSDDVPDALLEPGVILVMQQEVPLQENARLIERARARGVAVILNAAPAAVPDRHVLEGVDYLVVNEIELATIAAALDLSGSGADLCGPLASLLASTVVATFGAGGTVMAMGKETVAIPATPVDVVDTTGAGDTFVGVFAAGLLRGVDAVAALHQASAAAALCCTRRGAQAAQPVLAEYSAGK